MKSLPVFTDSLKKLVQPAPGFEKKGLADTKLDICGRCNFACRYCSSDSGNYLRINRQRFADATEAQLGRRVLPSEEPALTYLWPDVIPKLERELSSRRYRPGAGKVLVFSMLTDGFGPLLVADGTTEKALRLVLERTEFRIRVLTKSAIVGNTRWIRFFTEHRDRFVVGLSIGTDDDQWARRVEVGTSSPSARLRALHNLQNAGVPTYGMLCPVFPDILEGDRLERLVDMVRPELVEHLWAEPFNDRINWRAVREGYDATSRGHVWLTQVYEGRNTAMWSRYATELYERLHEKAASAGWLQKLRYLLYEGNITEHDAAAFEGLEGVLLQGKPDEQGRSKNPHIAKYQPSAA